MCARVLMAQNVEIEGRNSVYPDFDIIIMEVGLSHVCYIYIYIHGLLLGYRRKLRSLGTTVPSMVLGLSLPVL